MAEETIIRPPKLYAMVSPREIWSYRNLLRSMVRRELKSEFNQQYLAYVWPVFRPVLMVILFGLFRHYSQARTGVDIPYLVYVYSGLILWFKFTESVQDTSASIKRNAGLIKKVYFPKILTPISAILSNLVTFGIAAVPLLGMMIFFNTYPGWNLLILPAVILQLSLLILGIGCIFAVLGLGSGDWDRFLGHILYIGLFVSPVIYAPSMMPAKAQLLYALNPMVGLLMAFRASLFGDFPLPVGSWVYSIAFTLIVAFIGLAIFHRREKFIVDRL